MAFQAVIHLDVIQVFIVYVTVEGTVVKLVEVVDNHVLNVAMAPVDSNPNSVSSNSIHLIEGNPVVEVHVDVKLFDVHPVDFDVSIDVRKVEQNFHFPTDVEVIGASYLLFYFTIDRILVSIQGNTDASYFSIIIIYVITVVDADFRLSWIDFDL